MTLETREQVQESWSGVVADGSAAFAERFYEHLLERDPQLGRLFRGAEMGERGRLLVRTLGELVRGCGEPWQRPAALPPRSDENAWDAPHLAVVGHALLDALAEVLEARFTPAVRAGWAELFATHAGEIRRAALGDAGTSRVVPLHRRRLVEIGS